MEIRQLKTFKAVATLLSFNKAAEKLHYAQSSVSAQIQVLEEELGVQLFDRLGRGIALTEAGERLLEFSKRIIELTDETITEVTGTNTPQGALNIRIPESLGAHRFPAIINNFRSQFPKVRLRFMTCAHDGLQKDLRKGITDLAFLLTESIQAADLEIEVLGFEHLVLVAHPEHALSKQSKVTTQDLNGETLLLSKLDCSYRKNFQQLLNKEKVRPNLSLELNNVAIIKQCVMDNIGITILPEIAVEKEIARGEMTALPWTEGKPEVAAMMIWHRERWLSPTMAAFMDAVRKGLKTVYGQH